MIKEVAVTKKIRACDKCENECEIAYCAVCKAEVCDDCSNTVYLKFGGKSGWIICKDCNSQIQQFCINNEELYNQLQELELQVEIIQKELYKNFRGEFYK